MHERDKVRWKVKWSSRTIQYGGCCGAKAFLVFLLLLGKNSPCQRPRVNKKTSNSWAQHFMLTKPQILLFNSPAELNQTFPFPLPAIRDKNVVGYRRTFGNGVSKRDFPRFNVRDPEERKFVMGSSTYAEFASTGNRGQGNATFCIRNTFKNRLRTKRFRCWTFFFMLLCQSCWKIYKTEMQPKVSVISSDAIRYSVPLSSQLNLLTKGYNQTPR